MHGKSTVVRLIAELLRESGAKVVEMMADGTARHSVETDPFLLHRRLADAGRQGYDYVVLEVHAALVNSHVLPTLAIEMVVAVTDSPQLEAFSALPVRYMVLPHGLTPPKGVEHHNIMTFGSHEKADMRLAQHKLYRKGTEVSLVIDLHNELEVASHLVGESNALNVAAALAAVYVLGVEVATFSDGIARLEQMPGNYEYIPVAAAFTVAVDGAVSVESLLSTVQSAKALTKRRLLVATDIPLEADAAQQARVIADRLITVTDEPRLVDTAKDHEEAAIIAVRGARKDDTVLLIGRRYVARNEHGNLVIEALIGGGSE